MAKGSSLKIHIKTVLPTVYFCFVKPLNRTKKWNLIITIVCKDSKKLRNSQIKKSTLAINYLGSVKKTVGFLKFNDCSILLNLNMAKQNITPAHTENLA